jgi:hypothetical protein
VLRPSMLRLLVSLEIVWAFAFYITKCTRIEAGRFLVCKPTNADTTINIAVQRGFGCHVPGVFVDELNLARFGGARGVFQDSSVLLNRMMV